MRMQSKVRRSSLQAEIPKLRGNPLSTALGIFSSIKSTYVIEYTNQMFFVWKNNKETEPSYIMVVGKKCNPNPNRKLTEKYNKMSKYIQKVERCSFLISKSVKCVTRTGNLLLLISSLILPCFAKTFSFIVYFYILETHIIIRCRNKFKKLKGAVF